MLRFFYANFLKKEKVAVCQESKTIEYFGKTYVKRGKALVKSVESIKNWIIMQVHRQKEE